MNFKIILNVLAIISFAIHVNATTTPTQPINLTCEYLTNPLGIDIIKPRLSWSLLANDRNQYQTAYQIVVSDSQKNIENAVGNIWQTGIVKSAQSQHIIYAGKPLTAFTKYYWRVKWFDKNAKESGWSTIATFETAIITPKNWQAKWIDDGSKQFENDESFYHDDAMPLFKTKIKIVKQIASARMYVSGVGYAEVYINNKKLGTNMLDPGFTAYRKQVLYVTYDITNLLTKKQENTVGIMLGNGWYNPLPLRLFGTFNLRNHQQTGRPCVLAQILIKYTDGTTQTIGSNNLWQTCKGPILTNNVYLGEKYDARLEKSFTNPSGWVNATITQGPTGVLTPQMQPAIKITKIVQPVSIKQVGKDTFILDMGQNFAGVARIKVTGKPGTTVNLRYAEIIHPNGAINWITTTAGHIKEMWNISGGAGAPKTAWQKDTYILKGQGLEVWNPRFTYHAFRYLEITGWPGKPTLQDIEGLRMNANVQQAGSFACANPMFNNLHDKIQWTFLSNIFSIQSDCPGREKMAYGADIVATASAYMYNYDMANFYKKTVQDFANDQQPDGGLTEIAPFTGIAVNGYGGQSGPLGWQLAFAYLQKKMYQQYGDVRIIEEQYPVFVKQMDFLQAKAINGLFYWDIGDHEALDTKADAFTASCFYYHHAILAAEFATILNKKQNAVDYAKLANSIKNNIINKYYVPNTGRFDNATQGPQIFALWYNLSPQKDKTMAVLLQEFERHNNHLSTGIFSTMMLFDVLTDANKNDIAYTIANQKDYPGWGFMLANDATTLWESWVKPESASYNHPMFGSIDEWFYKSLLGINATEPGFKKIIIKPQPAQLAWAKGSYQSGYGIIKSDWEIADNNFRLKVAIPVNTTAQVWLPVKNNNNITEGGKKIETLKEIEFVKFENGYAVLNVPSGSYDFIVN